MLLIDDDALHMTNDPKRGRALVATRVIPAGTLIGDYLGMFFPKGDEHMLEAMYGMYAMEYDDEWLIFPTEESRSVKDIPLINHSCEENCGIISYRNHALFYALRKIHKGEELTVNYSISPSSSAPVSKYECHCGSDFCRGTFCVSSRDAEINDTFESGLPGDHEPAEEPQLHAIAKPLDSYPGSIPDYKEFDLYGSENVEPLVLEDTKIPPIAELRKHIRESGRRLYFKNIGLDVYGIRKNVILSEID